MKNETGSVFSGNFDLRPIKDAPIPVSMGTKSHASFLNLVGRFNPSLMARLHDEPGYRPYTVSPLYGGRVSGERKTLSRAQLCHLRVTMLNGGALWSALQIYFREAGPIYIHLDDTYFQLVRMFITPTADSSGWSGSADWQTLVTLQVDLLRSAEHAPSAIGIVGGRPGTGKSMAAHLYLAEEEQKWQPPDLTCVMLDIMPQETTKWLLDSIAHRISDMPRSRTSHEAFQQVLTAPEQHRVRLLMLDNADYLSRKHLPSNRRPHFAPDHPCCILFRS